MVNEKGAILITCPKCAGKLKRRDSGTMGEGWKQIHRKVVWCDRCKIGFFLDTRISGVATKLYFAGRRQSRNMNYS